MAFQLDKARIYGVNIDEPVRKRAIQRCYLGITALAADVDLDIGDDTPGTFWTAVIADKAAAATVQTALQSISTKAHGLVAVESPQLLDRIQIAVVAGAGEYSLAVQNDRPNIAVNAADGELSWDIVLEWELKDGELPTRLEYDRVA